MQSRLKSIPLWTGVFALIYLVANFWFSFAIPGWAEITTQTLAILAILFGVTNNPTNPKGF